ncbi:MAG: glutathione S-transferase family protein, partial [Pseudomonadota bacterium]
SEGKLILHHYDASTFSEKIRLLMGYKGLRWRSVIQPDVMPKADLLALTGGHRLVPVLQIGSDIYCDSACIMRRLARPDIGGRSLGDSTSATQRGLSQWGESIVFPLVTISLARGVFSPPSSVFSESFIADRQQMSGPGFNPETASRYIDWRLAQLRRHLHTLEMQFGDNRQFLVGSECSPADFAVYHPLWSLELQGTMAELAHFPKTTAWFDRMSAFGHGEREEITAQQALVEAANSKPATLPESVRPDDDFAIGKRVKLRFEAYNGGSVRGELAWVGHEDVAIRRVDDTVGEVMVFFPIEGYILSRET